MSDQRYDLDEGVFSLDKAIQGIRENLPTERFLHEVQVVDVHNRPIQTAVLLESTNVDGLKVFKLMLY